MSKAQLEADCDKYWTMWMHTRHRLEAYEELLYDANQLLLKGLPPSHGSVKYHIRKARKLIDTPYLSV
jgi:hypothetical protein